MANRNMKLYLMTLELLQYSYFGDELADVHKQNIDIINFS